jgi:hypothetical protein
LRKLIALIRPVIESKWLQFALVAIGILAGLDDAIEAWYGVADTFRLEVHHGVIATALSGVFKPLSDLLDYLEEQVERSGAAEV